METLLLMAEKQAQVLCMLNLKELQQWMLGKQLRGCRWWGGGEVVGEEDPRRMLNQPQSDGGTEKCRCSVCQLFKSYW